MAHITAMKTLDAELSTVRRALAQARADLEQVVREATSQGAHYDQVIKRLEVKEAGLEAGITALATLADEPEKRGPGRPRKSPSS